MPISTKTSAFKNLTLRQWVWLFEAYCRLVWVYFRLRETSTQWLNTKLGKNSKSIIVRNQSESHEFLGMHEAVRLAARCHIHQPVCLPKSIVLMDMLRFRGFPAQVVIGVNKRNNKLSSHAWIELYGKSIGEMGMLKQQFDVLEKLK